MFNWSIRNIRSVSYSPRTIRAFRLNETNVIKLVGGINNLNVLFLIKYREKYMKLMTEKNIFRIHIVLNLSFWKYDTNFNF